jgi:chromosome segregation protein
MEKDRSKKPKERSKENNETDLDTEEIPQFDLILKKLMDSDSEDDTEKIKKLRNILNSAQKKYQALIEKRDSLHEEANAFKVERNRLNEKKNKLVEEMKEYKTKRNECTSKMKEHKMKRDQAQNQAKSLITFKRDKSKQIFRDLPGDITIAEEQLKDLDMKYQTSTLTPKEENKLLDAIRGKYRELGELKKLKPAQQDLLSDIDDTDEKITKLFQLADEEHEEVVRLSEESQKFHDQMQVYVDDISILIAEADQKHEEFKKINDRATYYHERALDLRKQIVAIRNVLRKQARDSRKVIEEQNLAVKKALDDDEKIDEVIDKQLEELKNKGKIEM